MVGDSSGSVKDDESSMALYPVPTGQVKRQETDPRGGKTSKHQPFLLRRAFYRSKGIHTRPQRAEAYAMSQESSRSERVGQITARGRDGDQGQIDKKWSQTAPAEQGFEENLGRKEIG